MKFAEFLRTPFLTEHLRWLLPEMERHFIVFPFFITMTEPNAMCLFNIHILVLLFNLHTESKILTFINTNGKPDMLTEKYSMKNSYNKNILLE